MATAKKNNLPTVDELGLTIIDTGNTNLSSWDCSKSTTALLGLLEPITHTISLTNFNGLFVLYVDSMGVSESSNIRFTYTYKGKSIGTVYSLIESGDSWKITLRIIGVLNTNGIMHEVKVEKVALEYN